MINLLPSHDETLVLPLSVEEVVKRLSGITRNDLAAIQDKSVLFSGWIKEDRFRISLKVSRPNNFLTLIKASIESTSSGCLIFIDYQLFPTTKLFVSFWLLLTFLFSIAVGFQYSSFWYALGGVAIAICIYLITWSNFHLQLNMARTELLKVLE